MDVIIIGILFFIIFLKYLIFFDVVLSWLTLVGVKWRPKVLSDIIDPIYKNIKKIIPTTIGPIELTPIIVIVLLMFLHGLIIMTFPDLNYINTNF